MSADPADRPPTTLPRRTVRVTQLQVNAAKLRLVTDRKLGRTSPAWVQRLAGAQRLRRSAPEVDGR